MGLPVAGISIHALLAESDACIMTITICTVLFLSTLSLRRATGNSGTQADPAKSISIHALLAESDNKIGTVSITREDFYPRSPCGERRESIGTLRTVSVNFYPRSPCGERHNKRTQRAGYRQFLSTLSLRRATNPLKLAQTSLIISIHALLAESDPGKVKVVEPGLVFLSTLSLRRATN